MKAKLVRIVLGILSLALLWMYVTHYEQRTTAMAQEQAGNELTTVALVPLHDGTLVRVAYDQKAVYAWQYKHNAVPGSPYPLTLLEYPLDGESAVLVAACGDVLWIQIDNYYSSQIRSISLGSPPCQCTQFLPLVTK